ncbi:hypothetical protein [Pontibacillus marinus]|uniref:Spore coat protein n=1 Tax=Pontibacillus marinus BH030004 = DSM 16465 TaxID=1385511 RepID=A0A0A5I7E0_9BACI|nr:hypothetical protein [Pontibacillus marinus]KGX91752.1 hypothetical protein N783_00410 [Pontibacillus marinus BH030004 = DSM 16465]
MAYDAMYRRCCRYRGSIVRLNCRGRVHVGRVTRVTRSHVWIRPVGGPRGLGYGFGFGFGGFGIPFALGAITGIALASVFFW